MEWLEMANEVLALLTGLVGLIGTAVGAYFAIKNWIQVIKTKNSNEIWALLMEMADKAMEEAERSDAKGADKKEMVLKSIEAAAEAAGLEIGGLLTQLNTYIDQTIDFVDKMQAAKKQRNT